MTPTNPLRSPRARWILAAAALSIVALAGLTGCGSPPPRNTLPQPAPLPPETKQTFSLTNADLDALKKQAGSGSESGAAAYRLALYYETVRHDDAEAKRWMKASAEKGYVGGMYGYASYLKESSDPADRATARTWLQKVVAQGDDVSKSVAQRDLRELDAAQKAGQ